MSFRGALWGVGMVLACAAPAARAEPQTSVMIVTNTLTTDERKWSGSRGGELELSVKREQYGRTLESFVFRTHRRGGFGGCKLLRLVGSPPNTLYCASDALTRAAHAAKLAEFRGQATPLITQATIDAALLDYQLRAGVTSDVALRRTIDDLSVSVQDLREQMRVLLAERGARPARR